MTYANSELTRTDVDALTGAALIEFGANDCGHCQAARPLVATALTGFGAVRHLQVEDGRGRPLGRSFKVKLWPTLVFFRDGQEVSRLVRPTDADVVIQALEQLSS